MSEQLLDHYLDQYSGKPRAELDARRAEIIARMAEFDDYVSAGPASERAAVC